jgi:UDP-GlcNAc3NAcA epimerase
MKKIVTVVGARPQFIKASMLSKEFCKSSHLISEVIVHTGQHFDSAMSDIFFKDLELPLPNYNLGIGGGSHAENTGRMIESLEKIYLLEKPDCVLVYGDTDSTLAGALAASKINIPIAHVEAGLRSYNKRMPEEINRLLTDHLSHVLFTPTTVSTNNLIKEGIDKEKHIVQVGDIMYDAALYFSARAQKPKGIADLSDFILATIHRAENTDDLSRLESIFAALNKIAVDVPVVMPLHPRTKNALNKSLCDFSNIIMINPVGYFEILWLLKKCSLVFTDSGGLQKEAYFFKKNCIIPRSETEWIELVELKCNYLIDANYDLIISHFYQLLNNPKDCFENELYGSGNTANKICKALI